LLAFFDATSTRTGKAVSVFSLVSAVIITYEIVVRDFFHRPTVWVAEGTVFACGLVYLLGGAWTLLEDKHVRVDVLYVRLSPRGKAIVDCLTYFCFALYIVVMIWAASRYTVESIRLGETTMTPWDPPIWPMKIAMLLALTLLFFQGSVKFVRDLHLAITGRKL
jgi:TRAP-type mannitol/chloroaromatic compound transport system permease small subunit